ncbi:MAG TPA: hypothetical protein VFX39_02010 [Gemmatimonadaceae bacterium]|nr:hypothetical protein [Gemmatimonadaceae bacterium]
MKTGSLVRQAALAATILTVGSGCDKASEAELAAAALRAGTPGDTLDVGSRPPVLYQLFGERHAPRMLPVAAVVDGRIEPIILGDSGWRAFDLVYHRPGSVYTIYQDGRATGTATVTKPMWDADGRAIYRLPGCRAHTPLAAVDVDAPLPAGFLVEHLATDAPIADRPRRPVRGAHLTEARRVASAVAEELGVSEEELERLEFRSAAVATGASDSPTLAISFIDATGRSRTGGPVRHLFILADAGPAGYAPTYTRLVRSTDSTGYRRYVDHLDLTGDGVDELILDGWSSGHESHILILGFRNGRWEEVFRGRQSWCMD